MKPARTLLTRFVRRSDGSMTVAAIFFVMATIAVGSLAVDFSRNSYAEADLQVLADSVAHAALVTVQDDTASNAITEALAMVTTNSDGYADAIAASDIVFGTWDKDSRTFTPDATSNKAVRVTATRNGTRDNYVESLFSRALKIKGYAVEVESVLVADSNVCATNGLVAETKIDISSNNDFGDGYCIHSDNAIDMSNNNDFGTDSVVSLPNKNNLTASISNNVGLDDAIEELPARLDALYLFNSFKTKLMAGDADYVPPGVVFSTANPIMVNGTMQLAPAAVPSGQTYVFTCNNPNGGGLKFDAGTYANVVIVTNCKIDFSGGPAFESVTLLQENPSATAMSGASGATFGKNDNCAQGGDTLVLTTGSVHFAASLTVYGSTLLALGDIQAAANADGMQGASIISGGTLKLTSESAFGFCPDDRPFPWRTFRFVL